ncbi:hypothetical protein K3495_g3873 [Podosphaera aphanis]|nr:hypothetical protein K3495_g3873 [Podosphaera aphanis]
MLKNRSKLETVTISCRSSGGKTLAKMNEIPHVRVLNIEGISRFTYEGVLGYINDLHATKKGLEITTITIIPKGLLKSKVRSFPHQAINPKVGGHFGMYHGK